MEDFVRNLPVYDTLETKVKVIYDFLKNDSDTILVLVAMGGSGKTIATKKALDMLDPQMRESVEIIYDSSYNIVKGKKYIVHDLMLQYEDLAKFMNYKTVQIVKFVRGSERIEESS